MTKTLLARLFEHNNWATLEVIEACGALTDEQLDTVIPSASDWSVRRALTHLVESQRGYVSLLTLPPEARRVSSLAFPELFDAARTSGDDLLALVHDDATLDLDAPLRTTDGYDVAPWVVLVQVINHATDHRRQICRILRAFGVTPPQLDGWGFGEAASALVRVAH